MGISPRRRRFLFLFAVSFGLTKVSPSRTVFQLDRQAVGSLVFWPHWQNAASSHTAAALFGTGFLKNRAIGNRMPRSMAIYRQQLGSIGARNFLLYTSWIWHVSTNARHPSCGGADSTFSQNPDGSVLVPWLVMIKSVAKRVAFDDVSSSVLSARRAAELRKHEEKRYSSPR